MLMVMDMATIRVWMMDDGLIMISTAHVAVAVVVSVAHLLT